jgi:FkbM family methyltransferase
VAGIHRRVVERARRSLRPTPAERRIASFDLKRGDLAIDCGANIGNVTAELARRGAFVYAFEPNPHAFAVLARRLGDSPNVELRRQAVLHRDDTVRLYFHVDAADDPIGSSTGSSVLPFKGNIDPTSYIEVEAIDLSKFVLSLEQPVRILKLDVEGAECPIVHRLIDTGAIERVDVALVEVHDRHISELRGEYEVLRTRLEREGLAGRVYTDWE